MSMVDLCGIKMKRTTIERDQVGVMFIFMLFSTHHQWIHTLEGVVTNKVIRYVAPNFRYFKKVPGLR